MRNSSLRLDSLRLRAFTRNPPSINIVFPNGFHFLSPETPNLALLTTRNREILKTTTLRRGMNFLLLKSSYHLSRLLKKPVHWGKPMAISIEPTTACNLRCPQCPSGLRQFTRPTGNLKPKLNQRILDNLSPTLQYINYYFQGEPFIHPQFLDLVKAATDKNIYVATSTNAHFISEITADKIIDSGLNEAIISIDGTTQETYEQYRVEGQLQKVLEGTKNLIAAKKKRNSKLPVIAFQFLVVSHNEHQIEEVQKIADELGVDQVNYKTVQVYDYETGNNLIPKNEEYSRYKKNKDGSYSLKNKFQNSCWRMWSSCVFTWDGKIVPCCFDKDAQHQMGILENGNFKDIWRSAIYKKFRQNILKDRKQIEICKNCSEGSKVWI